MNIQHLLIARFQAALASLDAADAPVPVSKSTRPGCGEYQFNGAMGLAKKLQKAPRDIAQMIVDAVALDDVAEQLEIAGPGFINIHLAPKCLWPIHV